MAILIFVDVCIYAQMYKWFNGIRRNRMDEISKGRGSGKAEICPRLMQGPVYEMPVYRNY
ncbi:hypothetical protein [Pedobacter caeni]|uniref:hypothetical protein n=1 Tax=Pedobacter caeni TaxID=288992 RepID=UPI000933C13A|nr:hypothetical protein [Pedobacter caeni]